MNKHKKKALKKAKKHIYRITGPWEGHETVKSLYKVLKQLLKAHGLKIH